MNFIYQIKNKQKVLNLVLILDRTLRAENAAKLYSKYLVRRIRAKLVSNQEENMLYNKSQQIFCRRKMSMLTGMELLSLACKCVFYRPEHNEKEKGTPWSLILKLLKWRNEIYQQIELKEQMKKKWGAFVYLSCLLPKLLILKYQKWLIFCIFC